MFERFSARSREILVLAQDAARSLGHSEIRTEHLLLGVLAEREGVAAWTLTSLGVDLVEASELVTRFTGADLEPKAGQLPFAYPAKRALELAIVEADRRGAGLVGTEHVLLGVLDAIPTTADGDVVSRVLSEAGVSPTEIREAIARHLSSSESGRGG